LGALISHEIFIFPREISSFSLGKIKISWEISVPKLALKELFITSTKITFNCCRTDGTALVVVLLLLFVLVRYFLVVL
jgi:hypothetical protein